MMNNSYDLQRFVAAHRIDYATALSEIKRGKKYSHWMWYIFPQVRGLGMSTTSWEYGTDKKKLRSSMTLFTYAAGEDSVFKRVLDKFFGGKYDGRTKELLNLK